MKREFVTYEIALALKELGFQEECLTTYMKYPLPPYDWRLQSIISSVIFWGDSQNDSHKSGFTGYVNGKHEHFGLTFVAAPLYQQAFRWFREKYDLHHDIGAPNIKGKYSIRVGTLDKMIQDELKCLSGKGTYYNTYEEAQDKCLEELIKLVRDEQR